jgi:hypothetical protein
VDEVEVTRNGRADQFSVIQSAALTENKCEILKPTSRPRRDGSKSTRSDNPKRATQP